MYFCVAPDGREYGPIKKFALAALLRSGQVQPFTLVRKSTWRKSKLLRSLPAFYQEVNECCVGEWLKNNIRERQLFKRCDEISDAPSDVHYPYISFKTLQDAPGLAPAPDFNESSNAAPPPNHERPNDTESPTPDFLVHEAAILDGELVVRPNFITQAASVSPTKRFHWKFWAFLATALIGFTLSQSVSAFWVAFLVLSVAVCTGIAVYFVCADSFDA